MSWLDIVPTCDQVFVYQAALVCEDCAGQIMERLDKKGVVDEDGDSDTYPQGPYGDGGGEADSCQFCDSGRYCVNAVKVGDHKIGCPLGNPLTSDGIVELQLSIADDMFASKKFSRRIGRLLCHVWGESIRGALFHPRTPLQALGNLPASLKKLVKNYELRPVLLCDPDNAYLLGERRAAVLERADLLRAPVDEEGEFHSVEVASLPMAVLEGGDPWKLLSQAVADGAWD